MNSRTPLEQVGKFCNEWEQSTLQRACSLVTDGTHDSPKESNSGFPLVTGKCIKGGELNIDAAYLISEEDHKKVLTRSHAKQGDLLFANIGNSIGEVCQIKQEVDISIKNLALFRPSEKLDGIFLLSYLRSKQVQNYIRNSVFGSAQPFIGLGSLREFPVPVPPIDEQKEIAKILGSIDEKIELNKKNNETLEDIAKALFKSWFIDFDPVKAKIEGRSTGLPDEISNLFPDSFEDSELGVIPKGWEIKSLPNIFDFLEGPGIRNWQYTNDETGIRFINIRCINNRDLNVETSNRITEEEALGKYKHFGLLEDDIVVSTSGTLGKYAIVRKEHLPLNLNTSVIRFRPIENQSTFSFLYGFIENKLQYELEIRASGSVQRNFGPMHLREIELLLPNINLLKVHEKYVEHLFKKRKLNLGENNLLSNLRDTLLPKLISGELRIPDAEKMIEEIDI